jgi:cytochrome c-type biogenesis protein CcmH
MSCAARRNARVLLLAGGAAPALDANGQLEDQALQARFERITQDLRCLVCQNESIADSNAELAAIFAARCARC